MKTLEPTRARFFVESLRIAFFAETAHQGLRAKILEGALFAVRLGCSQPNEEIVGEGCGMKHSALNYCPKTLLADNPENLIAQLHVSIQSNIKRAELPLHSSEIALHDAAMRECFAKTAAVATEM